MKLLVLLALAGLACALPKPEAEPVAQPEAEPEADPAFFYSTGLTYPHTTAYTGLPTTYTGLPTTYTGLPTTYTGLSAAYTGLPTAYTGLSAAYTGLPTTYSGLHYTANYPYTTAVVAGRKKRSAEAEPEADPEADPALVYTSGLTLPHSVVSPYSYRYNTFGNFPTAYTGLPTTYTGLNAAYTGLPTAYSGLQYTASYPYTTAVVAGRKKRSAEPEAEPEADPALLYTTNYHVPAITTKSVATYTVPHATTYANHYPYLHGGYSSLYGGYSSLPFVYGK